MLNKFAACGLSFWTLTVCAEIVPLGTASVGTSVISLYLDTARNVVVACKVSPSSDGSLFTALKCTSESGPKY